MIDFHTHILPNVDDGSDSIQTSIKMLNELKKQGVKCVCFTPHFYPGEDTLDNFIEKTDKSFCDLDYKDDLDLVLGSEVHYYHGISNSENLNLLCIGNSNALLVELPFYSEITKGIIDEIIKLNCKFQVVLAHIERYDLSFKQLDYLRANGVLFQCNANFLNTMKGKKYIKNGYVDCIGSDAHNLDSRPPNFIEAKNAIISVAGEEYYNKIIEKMSKILDLEV